MWFFIISFLFFFSSRRRHTRSTRDWSSDVCSSDLARAVPAEDARLRTGLGQGRGRQVHPLRADRFRCDQAPLGRWERAACFGLRSRPDHLSREYQVSTMRTAGLAVLWRCRTPSGERTLAHAVGMSRVAAYLVDAAPLTRIRRGRAYR